MGESKRLRVIFFSACVTPGCCKPLRYLEIRNRVWHSSCPHPKSKEECMESGELSCFKSSSLSVGFLRAFQTPAILLRTVTGPNPEAFCRRISSPKSDDPTSVDSLAR